ncbi:methyltransferase domain-containing protein [Megalodesulfovibrio paquesii]
MKCSVQHRVVEHLQHAVRRLKSSRPIRRLLYNISNVDEFSNLYEHEKMLADVSRVQSYAKAIARHVQPGDVVVDLGTGTGLLALLAARRKPRVVVAIEHSSIIHLARELAARNTDSGSERIRFVLAHSTKATLTPEEGQADLILHEQMGDLLFNENMVANLLDLKARLLKPTGRILPARFEVFLEPVCLKEAHRVPFLWELDVEGLEVSFLRESEFLTPLKRRSYPYRWLDADAVEAFACTPEPIFTFDLNTMHSESEIPHTLAATRTVTRSGRVDGLCFHFRALLDEDIAFDTSPLSRPTSWGRRLFRLPARHCEVGQTLACSLHMPDLLQINTWTASMEA